jgi:transcriptional regulator with XRE-family HTH domain
MDILKILGENVRKYRKEAGLSQEQLAERADLHWTYISGIERGIRNPAAKNIQRIAEGLNVKAFELLLEDSTMRPMSRIKKD